MTPLLIQFAAFICVTGTVFITYWLVRFRTEFWAAITFQYLETWVDVFFTFLTWVVLIVYLWSILTLISR